jgi:hypothetical protein
MPTTPKRTLIRFDLAAILKPEELAKFEEAAKQAGAKTLTEHFLNLTLRLPENRKAA